MEHYKILNIHKKDMYSNNCPLIIKSYGLSMDNAKNQLFVQLKFQNITHMIIKAIYVDILCYGPDNEKYKPVIDYVYLDLQEQQGSIFGSNYPIYLTDLRCRKIEIICHKIIFEENKSWENKNKEIYKDFIEKEDFKNGLNQLHASEVTLVSNQLNINLFKPKIYNNIIQCVCGEYYYSDSKCLKCNKSLEDWESLLSKEALEKNFKKREAIEKKRIEDEKKSLQIKQLKKEAALEEKKKKKENIKLKQKKFFKKYYKYITLMIFLIIVYSIVNQTIIKPKRLYEKANNFVMKEKYYKAYKIYSELGNYKDSVSKKNDIKFNAQVDKIFSASVGDSVYFGTYEQDSDSSNGKEKIEWNILKKDKDKVLLISKYGLDGQFYNESSNDGIYWNNCYLRKWLNEIFVKEAFTEEEYLHVLDSQIDNNDDDVEQISTQDKVFLLSVSEAESYFENDDARKKTATEYARSNGVDIDSWLLRTTYHSNGPRSYEGINYSINDRYVSRIHWDGGICYNFAGAYMDTNTFMVCPCIWIGK